MTNPKPVCPTCKREAHPTIDAFTDQTDRLSANAPCYREGGTYCLRAALANARGERDEARRVAEEACARYNELLQRERVLTCAFCKAEYPPGTRPSQAAALTEHILRCTEHPLRLRFNALRKEIMQSLERLDLDVIA